LDRPPVSTKAFIALPRLAIINSETPHVAETAAGKMRTSSFRFDFSVLVFANKDASHMSASTAITAPRVAMLADEKANTPMLDPISQITESLRVYFSAMDIKSASNALRPNLRYLS
jgi:hypothetical protein